MVVRTFDPITWDAEQVDLGEFQTNLVYIVSFIPACSTRQVPGQL